VIRIESSAGLLGTKVYLDDIDISRYIIALTWSKTAAEKATATITFVDVQIAATVDTDHVISKLRELQNS
jgi:hypothetical protein